MKKFFSHKELNKIAKGALAIVLTGSLTLSATNAFADSGNEKTNQNQVVNTQTGATTEINTSQQTSEKDTAPSLLPGDFFYFTKILLEKIQLALSFNDVKDAHLLASFASERLAEAESLFTNGDEKTAVETIKAAMEDMNAANKLVDDQEGTQQSSEDSTKNQSGSVNQNNQDQVKPEDQNNQDQVKAEDQNNQDQVKEEDQNNQDQVKAEDQNNQDQVKAEDQNNQDQVKAEDQNNQDQAEADDQNTNDNQDEADLAEVKNVLSQNIIALTAALNKVKNPEAKAALKRNIEKSYAHLEKKLAKWEEHHGKEKENANKDSEQKQVKAEKQSNTTPVKATSSESAAADDQTEVKTKADSSTEVKRQEKHKEETHHYTKKTVHHVIKHFPQKVKHIVEPVKQKTEQEIKQKHQEVKSFLREKSRDFKHFEGNDHEQGNDGNKEREND